MSESLASTVSILLGATAVGAVVGVAIVNRLDGTSPRAKLVRSLFAWAVVVLAGLAIWAIARGQISR